MPRDLKGVLAAAEAGDFELMETQIKKYSSSAEIRQASRELALLHAIEAGHTGAARLLEASGASKGNIALSHWNLAEKYLTKADGLKLDLARVEAHLAKSAPFIRKMNGGKLLVSNAVKRHIKKPAVVAVFDSVFGEAMSRFVPKGQKKG